MGVIEQRQRMIAAQPHFVTASGSSVLVNIAEPKIERLKVTFTPVQTGSGTPSPSNVRPISGWSNVSAALYRDNLFDGVFSTDSQTVTYRSIYVGNSAVTVSSNVPLVTIGSSRYANLFALAGSVTSGAATGTNDVYDGQSRTITPVNGYITIANRVWNGVDPTKYPLVISPSPCVIAGVDLGGTYYGGVVDLVSGVMTVRMVCETHTWGTGYTYQQTIGSVEIRIWPLSNNTSDITVVGNSLCSIAPWEVSFMADRTHYYTAAGGGGQHNLYIALPVGTSTSTTFTHCYDLQTPYTVTLTPQTISALRGQQTVTSPAGAVEISYWTN